MYHVGRPGEDGYTERVLAAWGVDGHNSHTNICSSSGRAGYQLWMGYDRPSPDHANAELILLISAHLESGHYFNPHAQRIMDGKARGAKLVVLDVRLSNTATHADHWLAPWPGSEPAILLAIANYLIQEDLYDREFVRRCWNWQEYMEAERPGEPASFEAFEKALKRLYAEYSFDFAERESGVAAAVLQEVARLVAEAGPRLSSHNWRSAAAGNLGGWQVSRTPLPSERAHGRRRRAGRRLPKRVEQVRAEADPHAAPPAAVERAHLAAGISARDERDVVPAAASPEGRPRQARRLLHARLQPGLDQPRRVSWIEAITDEAKIGLHVALTPIWSESAYFADYVLPVGLGSERHDLHSYETHDAQWLGFRQPVLKRGARPAREKVKDTREVNPGEVWEENEFWIDLSWRIDPDGALGIRKHFESKREPGEQAHGRRVLRLDLRELRAGPARERARRRADARSSTCAATAPSRSRAQVGAQHTARCPTPSSRTCARGASGARLRAKRASPLSPNVVPVPSPDPDADGRRLVGIEVDGAVVRGFPTPSGRLEFYSSTLKDWGWPEHALPSYIRSHVHPQSLEPGEFAADPHLPSARPDPHAQREREMAQRNRAHESALDPPDACGAARRRDRRPRSRRDARSATSS